MRGLSGAWGRGWSNGSWRGGETTLWSPKLTGSLTRPSILYNGGRIVDPVGRPLYSRLMEENLANRILEYVWTLPLELQVSGNKHISCRETDTQTRSFFANLGPIRFVTEPVVTEPVFRICLWMESRLMPEVEKDLTQ